jgi:hypothetical protein
MDLAAYAVTQAGYGDLELLVMADGESGLGTGDCVDRWPITEAGDTDAVLAMHGYRRTTPWESTDFGATARVQAG